jgi:diguanylate cyclase (GGDEF)-like protein
LTSDVVNCLYEDHQGGLWAGTEGRGLNRLIEGKFFPFTQEDGLSDDYVLSLCQDREGLLWVGTYGGGLNRLWEGKFTTYTVRDGLPSNEIRTILETRDGSVWMGTRAAGLARLRDEKIEKYSTENGLPNNTVRALFEDAEGDLWIGTNNGLSRYRHGRFTNYSRNEGLAHDYVRCIAQDLAGRIWVGTTGGGLHLLQNGRFINYRDRDVPETVIRGLSVVRDGSLWIGSNDGLTHWQDGRATHYSAESGLPPAPVYIVYEDSAGTLWIGTYGGGLCRFRDGRFTRYTVREGLFDDVVYQILDDGRGLWMSSNLGIFRVSKTALDDFAAGRTDRLTCVSYGTADGMRSSECNGNAQPAGWKTRDGRLWFPTTGGVVVVDPAAIPGNRLPPLVSFEDVRINRQSYCPVIEAVVPPGADSFEARFAGLSFIAPEKVRYKYRLEGLDKEWIEAGGRREAYYTNLSPGSYRFRVLACNNDGLWDETGAAFTFTLRPSFFQRRGFYILVALTFILLGITASEWRLRRLRTRQRELSGLVDVRTRELAVANLKLEDANRRLEELANTDPLTGLANRRYFMAALEVERRRCERLALPLSVIMADVDHFKLFNDAYGHHAGDECLVRLASLMRETVARAGDLVGRYGGEEFIILLPATGAEGAARAAERLRRHIEEAGIEHPSSSCGRNVTVSFGVATFVPKAGLAPDPLLEAADQALYEAKNAGRNCSRTRTL